jgi:hypothetical protein
MLKTIIIGTVSLAAAFAVAGPARAENNILFIFDSSNSMWGQVDGVAKIESATAVLKDSLGGLGADMRVGLMAYGHRRASDCSDVEMLAGIGTTSASQMQSLVQGITPRGKTPLAGSLQASEAAFRGHEEENNTVVLISDGIETCEGDPCAVAAELAKRGFNLRIHTVGFDVDQDAERQLMCIAEAGGGQYFQAANADALRTAMNEVKVAVEAAPVVAVQPDPPPPPKPARSVYFQDDFDGADLAEEWRVLNPDPNAYIVEAGKLLMANAGGVKGFETADTPNIMLLEHPLPDGNWDLTVKLRGELKTGNDSIWFGLYTDAENFMGGRLWTKVGCCGCSGTGVELVRNSGGQQTQFGRIVRGNTGCGGWDAEPMVQFLSELASNDLSLKLTKRGREYRASLQIEGEKDNDGKPVSYETDALTSLRSPGKVALAVGQWKAAQGETLINVDSVTIESVPE